MPWGFDPRFSSYAGAPRGYSTSLTLEDLYAPPPPRPAYPDAPAIPSSYGDLGAQAKKDLRREAILRLAQSLAAPNGRVGEALAGAAGGVSEWKAQQLEQARVQAERDYAAAVRKTDLEAARGAQQGEEEQRRRQAEGKLSLVRAIAEREPDLASQAEAAARSGDEALLRETAKEADRRARARAAGQDPNDPFADERTKARIQSDEIIRRQEELKKRGLSAYFDEPGQSVEEIEARAAAAARGQRSVWGDRNSGGAGGEGGLNLRTSNGIVGEVVDDGGHNVWRPLPGQADSQGEWRLVPGDPNEGTKPYWVNPSGATRPVADPPRPVAQVLGDIENTLGRKLTAAERSDASRAYAGGKKPRDIVSGLRAPQKITAPATAPTQGQPPKPKGAKSGPPPKEVRQREGTKPKLNERTKEELRRRAKVQWDNFTEAERRRLGSFEDFVRRAQASW